MSNVFLNKPQLRRRGITVEGGEIVSVSRSQDGLPEGFRGVSKNQLSLAQTQYPTFMTVRGGFSKIATGAISINAAECGWFPLIRLVAGQNIAKNLALFGLTIEQTSADVSGIGGGIGGSTDPLAWGNVKGEGCGIVAGEDLPTRADTWTSAPCRVPGIQASGAGLVDTSRTSQEILSTLWAPGAYNDPVPYRRLLAFQFSPYVLRMRPNSRFDVALVVDRQFINTANKNIFGSCVVQAHFGLPWFVDELNKG